MGFNSAFKGLNLLSSINIINFALSTVDCYQWSLFFFIYRLLLQSQLYYFLSTYASLPLLHFVVSSNNYFLLVLLSFNIPVLLVVEYRNLCLPIQVHNRMICFTK